MFEISHRFLTLLTLAAAAAPLLHRHHFLEPFEVDIQHPHKLPAVHEIRQRLALAPEETGEEADTCVVLIHFVLFAADGHLFLEEAHHVQKYFPVERRQFSQEIEDERNLLLRFDASFT